MIRTILIVAGICTLAFSVFGASKAECVWCPKYTCYAKCSSNCACISKTSGGGTCYSIQLLDSLEGEFTILE